MICQLLGNEKTSEALVSSTPEVCVLFWVLYQIRSFYISNAHTKSLNYGESEGKSSGESFGTSASEGVSYGVGEAISFSQSKSLTDSLGKSESISLCAKNMTLTSVLNRLEKQLQRIDECESLGMWNFAAYFVGESLTESETAANIYQSVVSGIKSGIETSAINTWHEDEKVSLLTPYIKNFIHPVFKYHGFDYEGDRYVNVTPAVLVSTNELTIHMGLPYRSVKGLPVIEHAVFAQEVLKKSKDDKELNLGSVYHLGNTTKTPVNIDLDRKKLPPPCSLKENWNGRKCLDYCAVKEHCPQAKAMKEVLKVDGYREAIS